MTCCCTIIPPNVLERLASDPSLPDAERQALADTAALDSKLRALRRVNSEISGTVKRNAGLAGALALAPQPAIVVYDCQTSMTLPGTPVPNPGTSPDATAARTFGETDAVARFFSTLFGRNSIDGRGMTLLSSIHYGSRYNNAFWNGSQMSYGDGDGSIFVDFTKAQDVIAHELTHGVTQHSAGFAYTNEAGGLNESVSDVFGSMFRQWRNNQDVNHADWLIGKEIMGPAALARGFTCLRDMAAPKANHCLGPQPDHYSGYRPGMDPHESSGIPNRAFYLAAMAIGGNSWDTLGKVWYDALTGYGRVPGTTFRAFKDRTLRSAARLFPGNAAVDAAIRNAWATVGV